MQGNTQLTLTAREARRLAITRQRLAGPRPAATRDGMMSLLRDLRCVQLDPIRAVERTQYLVLWSRLGGFDPETFHALLYQDWQLFEYWAHAASIVLVEDYPLHQAHMRAWGQGKSAKRQQMRRWIAENEPFRRYVLDEIGRNGPLDSSQLEDRCVYPWPSSGWNNGRNVGMMLDFLWTRGELVVAGRNGLRRNWGLATDYLPDAVSAEPWSDEQVTRVAAQHAVRALGVATEKQIKQHFIRNRYRGLRRVLDSLQAEGVLLPVQVQEKGATWPGDWMMHADDAPLLDALRDGAWQPRTTLLSPFDNLICDRDRTELMWDFYFRIEIYVPKAKRQYGYYVLPILHGDRFIGRIDPKLDRKTGILHVNAVYAEDDAPDDSATVAAIGDATAELARFIGATDIALGDVPLQWAALRHAIA